MIAFVLSGGGNRGPLQVGALQVLLEDDIRPDMLVGTSAGAINAAFLALRPTSDAALRLGEIWKKVDTNRVFHGNRLTVLWRFLKGKDSLYPNDGLQRLIAESLPPGIERFGDLKGIKLYVVASSLDAGEARIFGEDPEERLLDALMASTALPPFFPPWRCGDQLLVDGGIAADLPIKIALTEGAKEVYALHLVDAPPQGKQIHGLLRIAERTITNVLSRQLTAELDECRTLDAVTLHHIPLTGFYNLPLWDLSHTEEMIEDGRRQMEEYLLASEVEQEHGRLVSLRQAVRRSVERAFTRLRVIRTKRPWGLEDEMEPQSGTLKVRS